MNAVFLQLHMFYFRTKHKLDANGDVDCDVACKEYLRFYIGYQNFTPLREIRNGLDSWLKELSPSSCHIPYIFCRHRIARTVPVTLFL